MFHALRHRSFIAVVGTAAVGTISLVGLAGPLSAHVTVNPNTAEQGGYAKLSFRVPTESDDTSTVKMVIEFPSPQIAAFKPARVQPHAGWSYTVETTHLEVPVKIGDTDVSDVMKSVTWTADTPEGGIKPGEFDEFSISLGPLPSDVDTLTFKAIQTYSDGEEVGWIESVGPDGEKPERPAPVLTLTAAAADHGVATKVEAEKAQDKSEQSQAEQAVSKDDLDGARTLGILGLVSGALGLATAIGALVVVRRRAG